MVASSDNDFHDWLHWPLKGYARDSDGTRTAETAAEIYGTTRQIYVGD